MKKHNNCFPRHYIKNINKLSFKTSGRRYKFFELDGEKQIKDNLLSHVNNLANGEPVYLSGLFGYIHEVHGVVSVGNLQISSNGEDFLREIS